jgi:hypothetical protein
VYNIHKQRIANGIFKQLKGTIMFGDEKKVKEKINFNKFFPGENSFVNVDGGFKDAADWWVDLTLQTGLRESTQLWVSDFKPAESLKQLRALLEATEKAIAFAEKCMNSKPAKVVVAKKPKK